MDIVVYTMFGPIVPNQYNMAITKDFVERFGLFRCGGATEMIWQLAMAGF